MAIPRAPAHSDSEPNWTAIQGGLVLFGASYTISVGGAISERSEDGTGWLFVPIAGPWVAMTSGADEHAWGLVLSGLTQAGGAGLLSYGFIHPRRTLGTPTARVAFSLSPPAVGDLALRNSSVAASPWGVQVAGSF